MMTLVRDVTKCIDIANEDVADKGVARFTDVADKGIADKRCR